MALNEQPKQTRLPEWVIALTFLYIHVRVFIESKIFRLRPRYERHPEDYPNG
jgi:hypothetical protein